MEQQIKEAASHYGKTCSFEKLVEVGTTEHNGLRYENIIPWTSTQDEWVLEKTRITGSTLRMMETCQIRNLVITQD